MSWKSDNSIVTYEDLYNRTFTLSGTTYNLNTGQTFSSSKRCMNIGDAQTLLYLNPQYIPDGVSDKRQAVREWLVPAEFPVNESGVIQVDINSDSTGSYNIYALVDTDGIDDSINHTPIFAGNNFLPSVYSSVDNCWIIFSDHHITTPNWRCQFNLKRFLVYYPNIDVFTFKINANSSDSAVSGSYSLKTAAGSIMVMNGSPGTYLPGVVSGTTQEATPFITHITTSDETIVTFTYDRNSPGTVSIITV